MIPIHTLDLNGDTIAVLGLNQADMARLRHVGTLTLVAERLGLPTGRFSLVAPDGEPAIMGPFLHLHHAEIQSLLLGEPLSFDMQRWGVAGFLFVGHRATDNEIAVEMIHLLEQLAEDD